MSCKRITGCDCEGVDFANVRESCVSWVEPSPGDITAQIIERMHAFAYATGAVAGEDVVQWFVNNRVKYERR